MGPGNVPPQVSMIINLSMRAYEKKNVYNLMEERRRNAEERKKQLGGATLVGKEYPQDDKDFIDANLSLVPREVAEFVSARQRRELVSILQKHIEIQKNETAENKPVQNEKKESKDRSREDESSDSTAENTKAPAVPQAKSSTDKNDNSNSEAELYGKEDSSQSKYGKTPKNNDDRIVESRKAEALGNPSVDSNEIADGEEELYGKVDSSHSQTQMNNLSKESPSGNENDIEVEGQEPAALPQGIASTDNNEKTDSDEEGCGNKELSHSGRIYQWYDAHKSYQSK